MATFGDVELGSSDENNNVHCSGSCSESRESISDYEAHIAPTDCNATALGPDGRTIDAAPTPSHDLACLILSNGSQVEFSGVEEDAGRYGIAIREIGDAERFMPSMLASMSRLPALDIYRKLSPKAPIPRLLAATSPDSEPDGTLVDFVEDPLEVDLDNLGTTVSPVQAGSASGGGYGGHFCVPGDGWHAFKAFACEGLYPANAAVWCDPSVAYYFRARGTSGHKRKHSLGITATCGSPALIRHYFRNIFGNWRLRKDWYMPDHHWAWTRYDGLSERDRLVEHISHIQGPPSFVRSFTAIYT